MLVPKKEVASSAEGHTLEPAAHAHALSERETSPQPERVVSVLAISPWEDDHAILSSMFSHSKWEIRGVRCWREALSLLSAHRIPVIICERDLPDSTWKEVLSEVAGWPNAPLLIVTSRLADDYLWAEVLNLGGYDVLMKPFDQTEVVRVVSLAWLNWRDNLERARRLTDSTLATAAGL